MLGAIDAPCEVGGREDRSAELVWVRLAAQPAEREIVEEQQRMQWLT